VLLYVQLNGKWFRFHGTPVTDREKADELDAVVR